MRSPLHVPRRLALKSLIYRIASPPRAARGETMTKLKLLGAIAALFALTAAPALSQQAIQEPGLYALYHPDGDSMSTRAPDAMASTVVRARGVHPRTRVHGR